MSQFYFPILFYRPSESWNPLDFSPYILARRLWNTSPFDIATLQARHKIGFAPALMNVMLGHCNVELRVEADSLESAREVSACLLLGLYANGLSPTICPFATSHSMNDYSGINSRDHALSHEGPWNKTGITSAETTVEAWPIRLALSCQIIPDALTVSPTVFEQASAFANDWHALEHTSPILRAVREAALVAPQLDSRDQSLLHIWCALESLFSKVSSETTFQIALYHAQLVSPQDRMLHLDGVKKAYHLRSKIAHGARQGIALDDWKVGWTLLMDAARSIVRRGGLPSEDELLGELLA